jgi:hypothetical protein
MVVFLCKFQVLPSIHYTRINEQCLTYMGETCRLSLEVPILQMPHAYIWHTAPEAKAESYANKLRQESVI